MFLRVRLHRSTSAEKGIDTGFRDDGENVAFDAVSTPWGGGSHCSKAAQSLPGLVSVCTMIWSIKG